MGMFAQGPHYYLDGAARKLVEATELDDRIDTLMRGFLGLTVSCARCHDHKFDPIPQSDYYSPGRRLPEHEISGNAAGSRRRSSSYTRSTRRRVRDQEAKIKQFVKTEGKGQGDKENQRSRPRKIWPDCRRELDRLKKAVPPSPPHRAYAHRGAAERHARSICAAIPTRKARSLRAAFPRILAGESTAALQARQWPARTGAGHRQPEESTDGARPRQSRLAVSLRQGACRHAQQFRQARRTANASRIARSFGDSLPRFRLVDEGTAPRNPVVGHLSLTDVRRRCCHGGWTG